MRDGDTLPEAKGTPAGAPSLIVPMGTPGEDRFWAWRDHIAPMWDIAVDDPAAARRFHAGAEVFHLGAAIVARSVAAGHTVRRTATTVARMGVDHIVVQVRRRGLHSGEAAGGTVTAAPGDICFLDAAQAYTATTTDYEAITVVIPRPLFSTFLGGFESPHGLVLRGCTPLGRLLAAHLAGLMNVVGRLSVADATAAASGTAALAASCCGPLLAGRATMPAAAVPAVLLAIRRHIEANLGNADLSADGIAVRFGLSRSALYRLFEPLGGVADYVRRRRLARAYADLSRTAGARVRRRITDVGSDYGFESGAAFSRAFRREFGFAPRDMQFAAGQQVHAANADKPGSVLHEWLVRLAQ